MERDNSNSTSKLQEQREIMNEELIKFNDNILLAMRTIESKEKRYSMIKWILETYKKSIVTVQENKITTEKSLLFLAGDERIDLSKYEIVLKEKREELKHKEYEEFEKQFLEEIKPEVIKLKQEWMNGVLKELNELVSKYVFYLKSVEVGHIYVNQDKEIHASFTCTIDIE